MIEYEIKREMTTIKEFLEVITITNLNPRYTRYNEFKSKLKSISENEIVSWKDNLVDLLNAEEKSESFNMLLQSIINSNGINIHVSDFYVVTINEKKILLDGNRRLTAYSLLSNLPNSINWLVELKVKESHNIINVELFDEILNKLMLINKTNKFKKFDEKAEFSYIEFIKNNKNTNTNDNFFDSIYIRFNGLHNNNDEKTKSNWSRYKSLIDSYDLKTKTPSKRFIFSNLILYIFNSQMTVKQKVALNFTRLENSINDLIKKIEFQNSNNFDDILNDYYSKVLSNMDNSDKYKFDEITTEIYNKLTTNKNWHEIEKKCVIIYNFTFVSKYKLPTSLWDSHGLKDNKLFKMFIDNLFENNDCDKIYNKLSNQHNTIKNEEIKDKQKLNEIRNKDISDYTYEDREWIIQRNLNSSNSNIDSINFINPILKNLESKEFKHALNKIEISKREDSFEESNYILNKFRDNIGELIFSLNLMLSKTNYSDLEFINFYATSLMLRNWKSRVFSIIISRNFFS